MEDSVYIYDLVRFVADCLGGGEEAKKNHKAVNINISNVPDRKCKELKNRDPHFLSFLPCFRIK